MNDQMNNQMNDDIVLDDNILDDDENDILADFDDLVIDDDDDYNYDAPRVKSSNDIQSLALTTSDVVNEVIKNIDIVQKEIRDMFTEKMKVIKYNVVLIRRLKGEISSMENTCARLLKKRKKKRVSYDDNGLRILTGFGLPVCISDELSDFVGAERGHIVPRAEITRYFCKYIEFHELKQQDARSIVQLSGSDAAIKFRKLLLTDDESAEFIQFTAIQKCMNRHVSKPTQEQCDKWNVERLKIKKIREEDLEVALKKSNEAQAVARETRDRADFIAKNNDSTDTVIIREARHKQVCALRTAKKLADQVSIITTELAEKSFAPKVIPNVC